MVYSSTNATTPKHADPEYEWTLRRDKNEIKIYTSPVANSKYKAMRSVMTLSGDLHSVISLITDLSACSQWVAMCKKSELVQSVSDTELYIYTYNNMPFPVKNRDIVAHVRWHTDNAPNVVRMTSKAVTGFRDKVPHAIRLEQANAEWRFTQEVDQNGDTTVQVESLIYIDPNGFVPAWINNLLLIMAPYKSMVKMRNLHKTGRYVNSKVSFLP